MRRKITVVGAGNVGATCAQRLAERDYANVVLIDSDAERAVRLALDMNVAGAITDYVPSIKGTGAYEELGGSEIVVIAVDDGEHNAQVGARIAEEVRDRAPDAVVVVVSNPLEPVCHAVYDVLQFPRERVVGLSGALHSAALRMLLAADLGVSPRDVDAVVLGGHADTMVPLLSCATVAGIAIRKRVPADAVDRAVERVREGATPREAALAPLYAPAAALAAMVDAIALDQRRVFPCAALTKGEYGFEEVFVGLPVKLAAGGIAEIVELNLDDDERRKLAKSARAVEGLVGTRARV
jgi:malate dehydrogenase